MTDFLQALRALGYGDGVGLRGGVPSNEAEYQARVVGPAVGRPAWADLQAKLEELQASALRAAVKAEARGRILARYPDWKQANMTARGVELAFKVAQGETLREAETTEIAALQGVWGWIKAVREASNALETLDPVPAGFADDGYWPA